MKKLLLILLYLPMIGFGQVDLTIAEDYIYGRSNNIFTELENKGYELVEKMIIKNDSAFSYKHKNGYDNFMLVKGQGFLIEPAPAKDGIDYFESYMYNYILKYILAEGDKAPKHIEKEDNPNIILDVYNGLQRFMISTTDSKIMIFRTDLE